jgi:class 3 adenylate cyclase
MEHKLAAILAADVAGYSRMMELDEAGTFERLKARRIELERYPNGLNRLGGFPNRLSSDS